MGQADSGIRNALIQLERPFGHLGHQPARPVVRLVQVDLYSGMPMRREPITLTCSSTTGGSCASWLPWLFHMRYREGPSISTDVRRLHRLRRALSRFAVAARPYSVAALPSPDRRKPPVGEIDVLISKLGSSGTAMIHDPGA